MWFIWIMWVIVAIAIIATIILLTGKGSMLVSGFNTKSPEERAKYDKEKVSKQTGLLMTTTEYICYQRARRTDAEPVMHKVNSLVIIGSFFQYMMRTCPD